jgi:ribosomal protein L31E
MDKEEFEDTKVVIRIRKSKDTIKWTKKAPKTMIYKTLHRKLTIKHHEPHKNWG